MKQVLSILVVISILFTSCNSEKGNMIVEGKIKGFQKGMVYLAKVQDTTLVKVDSIKLEGNNTFTLSDNVESPQIYFLSISGTNKILQFFGEKGEISIISDLKTYGYSPIIKGSKNQEFLDDFRKTNRRFTNLRLDLIKEKFDVKRNKDTIRGKEIEKEMINILRKKYLYTANFAVNHADYEVSPYLTLTEIYDANPKLIDTIVKSLSKEVRQSIYGKKLIEYYKKQKVKK